MEESADPTSAQPNYTVVARRYRPRSFDQLIGQEHVSQALGKAIATGRVGHAYLFTGARGVGKTSTARIFAKALNLHEGMSEELANEITAAIDSGDDIDVIEIDGASNRGINEIRQLRANVNVRPSRAKFKIYIIDEVHMLTKEAFNALLKTLEEPPAHVKFIFCTTDPDKIPITVLSRCQRFDFVPVKFEAIVARLQEIANNEGFECEPEALALLARRAAGSMRDSQSLLEQVMSFSAGKITATQVHALLGIADESLLLRIVDALLQRNALEAIAATDSAVTGGADAGQLSEQLLNFLRDIMAVGIGGSSQLLKFASPMNHGKLQEIAKTWGIQTVLSAIQILDESIVRMRTSVSASTLLEVAMVQICQLEQLASIPALIAALSNEAAQKKKPSPPTASNARVETTHDQPTTSHLSSVATNTFQDSESANSATASSLSQTLRIQKQNSVEPIQRIDSAGNSTSPQLQTQSPSQSISASRNTKVDSAGSPPNKSDVQATRVDTAHSQQPIASNSKDVSTNADSNSSSPDALGQWKRAVSKIEGLLADYCNMVVSVEPKDGSTWRVVFPPGAMQPRDYCEQIGRKTQIVSALMQIVGRNIALQFDIQPGQAPGHSAVPVSNSAERSKRMRELANHPLIKTIVEVLDAEITKVIPAAPKPTTSPVKSNSSALAGETR